MSRHATALCVLSAAAVLSAFSALQLRSVVSNAARAHVLLTTDLRDATSEAERLRAAAVARKAQDAPIAAFLAEWEPHFSQGGQGDPLETARALLQKEAQAQPVATSAWTTPAPIEVSLSGHRLRAQPLSLRVAGDLERVLAWLGQAEERLPAAKVMRAEIGSFGNGVALDLSLLLPLAGGSAAGVSEPNNRLP